MIWYVTIAFSLLCALLAYAAARPDNFRVRRTVRIRAPRERVFDLINDFRCWEAWSPFERLDPGMQRSYSGAPSGKGAVYRWSGNRKAGEGRMEIAHTSPPADIVIRLDVLRRPFAARHIVEFTLAKEDGATRATWSVRGTNSYLAKLLQLFVSMDRLVGKDFEQGLARLKALAEEKTGQARPKLVSVG